MTLAAQRKAKAAGDRVFAHVITLCGVAHRGGVLCATPPDMWPEEAGRAAH